MGIEENKIQKTNKPFQVEETSVLVVILVAAFLAVAAKFVQVVVGDLPWILIVPPTATESPFEPSCGYQNEKM